MKSRFWGLNGIVLVFSLMSLSIVPALTMRPGFAVEKAIEVPSDQSTLQVKQAWIRLPAKGRNITAAYVSFKQLGKSDKLIGIKAPFSETASLHATVYQDNIARMQAIDFLDCAENSVINMKPGGVHIMLEGLKTELKPGQKLPLNLIFQNVGPVQILADVRSKVSHAAHKRKH